MATASLAPATTTAATIQPTPHNSANSQQTGAQPRILDLTFYKKITDTTAAQLDFRSNPSFQTYTAPYEYVQLKSLRGIITLPPGIANSIEIGIAPTDTIPTTMMICPDYIPAYGGEYGTTKVDFQLSNSYPFGTELKAMTIGNPSPRIFYQATGASTTKVQMLRLNLRIEVSGFGIIPPIDMSATSTPRYKPIEQLAFT
jgi:hypothetical protein